MDQDDENVNSTRKLFISRELAIAVVVVSMVMNLVYAMLGARFAYTPIIDAKCLSMRNSNFALINVVFKFIVTLFVFLIDDYDIKKWLFAVISFVILSARFEEYLRTLPFYGYEALKIFLVCTCIQQAQITLNIFWDLVFLERYVSRATVLYTEVIFSLIFIKLGCEYMKKNIWENVNIGKKIDSEKKFFKILFSLKKILSSGSVKQQMPGRKRQSDYEILFNKIIKQHTGSCSESLCACKKNQGEEGREINGEKLYYQIIKDLFTQGISNLTNIESNFLKLQFANFLIENDNNSTSRALYLLNTLDKEFYTREMKILEYKTKRIIEIKLKNSFLQSSDMNVKQIIDYYALKQNLRYEIAKNTKLFADFWSIYKQPNPRIKKILSLNCSINIEADKISTVWEDFCSTYAKLCYKDYIIYGLYMQMIRSAPFSAEKLFSRYFAILSLRLSLQDQQHRKDVFLLEENAMLLISMNEKDFGIISFASENVDRFGYTIKELIGKSMGILMPSFFAKKHAKFLLNEMIYKDSASILNKNFSVYLRKKNGFITLASLGLIPFPYIDQGFFLLAVLRPIKNFDDYVLFSTDGKIDAISENLARKLNFEQKKIGTANISDLCADSLRIAQYVSRKLQKCHPEDQRPRVPGTGSKSIGSKEGGGKLLRLIVESQAQTLNDRRASTTDSQAQLGGTMPIQRSRRNTSIHPNEIQGKSLDENLVNGFENFMKDFEATGVELRFMPTANEFEDAPQQVVYNSSISQIEYQNEHMFILKIHHEIEENFDDIQVFESGDLDDKFLNSPEFANPKQFSFSSEKESAIPNEQCSIEVPFSRINPDSLEETHIGVPTNRSYIPLNQASTTQRKSSRGDAINMETLRNKLFPTNNLKKRLQNFLPKERSFLKKNFKDFLDSQRDHLIRNIDSRQPGETSSTRSVTRGMLTLARTERAIYYTEGTNLYKLVKASVIGFILMNIALFIYYQVQGNRNFANMIDNIDVLSLAINRLFQTVEMNRRTTVIRLIESGFLPRNRNGIPEFDALLVSDFAGVVTTLSSLNNNLRSSVYRFNKEQQDEFYEPIRIFQGDIVDYGNAFDLTSQIVSAGFRLYAALPSVPDFDNEDLSFIFYNTMNDLVDHSENLFTLLLKEDKRIVTGMTNLVLILLLILVAGGVGVILVLVRSEMIFIKRKMLFFDYFLRIGEGDVDITIMKATRFHELLENKNSNEEEIMNRMQELENAKPVVPNKSEAKSQQNTSNLRKKKANFKAVNNDTWLGVIFLILFIFCFWLVYTILYVFFIKRDERIQDIKEQIIESNLLLAHMSQGITMLYLYVGGGGDAGTLLTIRNVPLPVEWDRNMQFLIDANTFFLDLMNQDFGSYTETIKILASGDLCEEVENGNPTCNKDGHGAKLQGLIGVTNFFVSVIKNLRSVYDTSNKSDLARQEIYSDPSYSELERVYFDVVIAGYQMLEGVSVKIFLKAIDDFKKDLLMLNIFSTIAFIILGMIYWKTGLRKMQMEKMYFRRIFRTIPVNIILQNKFLQSYIMKKSGKNGVNIRF